LTNEGEVAMNTLINIEEIKSLVSNNKISLLYISSKNCGVCKVIYPRIINMLKNYPKIEAAEGDIDDLPLLAGEYNVFTLPCVLVFAEGKEILREARYIDLGAIEENIDRYYNMIF
jgi:thiol-disulfide isomerase/thioredoxin